MVEPALKLVLWPEPGAPDQQHLDLVPPGIRYLQHLLRMSRENNLPLAAPPFLAAPFFPLGGILKY